MTKHLDSLRVQNFRCFKDFTAEKLGDVNLIVGKNNSGKSTVLEALLLYAYSQKGTILKFLANSKDEILGDTLSDDTKWSKNFYNNQEITEQGIIISDNLNKNKYLCMQYGYTYNQDLGNNTFKKIFNIQEQQDFKTLPTIRFINSENLTHDIYFHNDKSNITEKVFTDTSLNVSFVGTKDVNFNNLSMIFDNQIQIFPEYKQIVIAILKTIEPSIEDFGFFDKNNSKKSRFAQLRLNNGRLVPMKSMGDGISTIFEILIKAFNAKDGILLIDEVENGLHFSVQKQVWQVLFELSQKLNMQIFATTHSWDAIEAFAQVAKENTDLEGVLMRMGRSARTSTKDNIIATIYHEDRLFDITQQEIEVR